jgi:uncharacterized protein (DUF885 family)
VSAVYDLADEYVDRLGHLDPIAATFEGIDGFDSELTDYSPDAAEERADHDRATIRALRSTRAESERDRMAADVMLDRLQVGIDAYELGEHLRDLNIIASPVQNVRGVFDIMKSATVDDWEVVAARVGMVPEALSSYQAALTEGVANGLVAAQRQVVGCIKQAEVWSGSGGQRVAPFFHTLVDRLAEEHPDAVGLRTTLEERAARATEAYASLARYLTEEYAPYATEHDAVGPERYAVLARLFSGTDLDLRETYEWGWEELHRLERAAREVGERILPGEPMAKIIELLETDPARVIEGEGNLRAFLQDLMDRTIAELDGTHFDIAEPIKTVEAMIAPPGGAAAMYYTGPSEDFTRPGRTWYPTLGKTRFPIWGEVSTCYHEGVPGHHLQVAQVRYLADELSRYQRTLGFVSGHGEGWALYAERLMGELGYLDNPDYELGMLRGQSMRAVRVVIDIGMHLELPIPERERYHPGEVWNAELALPFAIEHASMPADFMASEIDRYLGWPGQAISYKVGERVWLECREDAKRRHGDEFDLKAWHTFALNLGGMGLDQLRRELQAF